MHVKLGHQSALGSALRRYRKDRKLTQAVLAGLVGATPSAVRTAESGGGRLSTFSRLLDALGLELRGRTLPSGSVGANLAVLRQRRKQSRREIARALGVSRNTLAAIEQGSGLLSNLEAYAGALGAGLHVAALTEPRSFFTHAGNSSAHHGWETPPALADALTRAVGRFDLDPCAASADGRRVRIKARVLLTASDDGLTAPWRGLVFVNPPYGRALKAWVAKCAHGAEGATVVGLIPARPDTRWWHEYVAGHADVFMLRGRLQFGAGGQSAPFPSAVVVWRASPALLDRIGQALPGSWHIPGRERGDC